MPCILSVSDGMVQDDSPRGGEIDENGAERHVASHPTEAETDETARVGRVLWRGWSSRSLGAITSADS